MQDGGASPSDSVPHPSVASVEAKGFNRATMCCGFIQYRK